MTGIFTAEITDQSVASGIRNLRRADPVAIYNFLHVILNQLTHIIAHASTHTEVQASTDALGPSAAADGKVTSELAKEAFETLTWVVGLVHDKKSEHVRSPDLQSYIKFAYRNPKERDVAPTDKSSSASAFPRKSSSVSVFEALARRMLLTIKTYEKEKIPWLKECHAICISHTWVFFSLIAKSMA